MFTQLSHFLIINGKRLLNIVLQRNQEFNCGSSIISLLPFYIYHTYVWYLWDIFIETYINYPRTSRRQRNKKWPFFFLKKILTLILVWSSIQCWTDVLLPNLHVYTFSFLTMINNSLNPNYKMNNTFLLHLENIFNIGICYLVAIIARGCYIIVANNYYYIMRSRMRRRIPNWRINVPRLNNLDELGENGYLLMRNNPPPESNRSNFPENSIKEIITQSCTIIEQRRSNRTKITGRRKSI